MDLIHPATQRLPHSENGCEVPVKYSLKMPSARNILEDTEHSLFYLQRNNKVSFSAC